MPATQNMITYRAMYKFLDDGVHAEVLDFPGAITCGRDLDEARQLLRSALVDVAEAALHDGEPLPPPNPQATDSDADLEEPIYLVLNAATKVTAVPQDAAP
jgi:predicted RNase H-like HicB family nuclease